jgi:4-hydroxy-4-methyl-2-oxoglutarate aldolase
METAKILEMLNDLSTACLADACLRLDIAVRFAPCAIRPLMPGTKIYGPVRPARHFGGIDVFLEALENASSGEVLVVDNEGRLDEACIGDLISLEVKMAGLNGIVIWGLHRDTAELREKALYLLVHGERVLQIPIHSRGPGLANGTSAPMTL